MNKQFILIIFVLLLPFCYSELVFPSNYEVSVRTYEESNHSIIVKNTFDYKIYDVIIGGLPYFNFPYFDINSGEEKIINFTINSNNTGNYNYNAEISYKYEVDLPIEENVHSIEIKDTGFNPNFITIRKGDSIVWYNNDTITRTVTTSTFDESIAPNKTLRKDFNDLGTITYQDLTLFQGGTISVVNETQGTLVQNSEFNINWHVNLNLYLENSSLEITNTKNDFNISVNDSSEGILEIKNTGTYISENIELSANPKWISFEKNNFNLEPNKNIYVIYHVTPLVFQSSETNMTHNISINIKGDNTIGYTNNIAVFVPYHKEFNDLSNAEGFLSFYINYCKLNPNTLICNNTIASSQEPQIIYRDPEIPINITQKEAYAMLRRQSEVYSSIEVINNELKKSLNIISNDLPEIKKQLEEIKEKQSEIEDTRNNDSVVVWLVILFVIIISSIIIVGLTYTKYRMKKDRGT